MRNMFSIATKFRAQGADRVYSYNWFGIENGGCGSLCRFDAGLVDPGGAPSRPAYAAFKSRLADFSR
jgi:hypothetical protein